jgi:4a-hydroxytetrahydrobiopterin dehydratase
MSVLDKDEVNNGLARLEGWAVENYCLVKEFKFNTFSEALNFMNRLAPVAEKLNHHPDWSNSYNKVAISLTTHSEGGLTKKDFAFAEAAEREYI